MHQVRMLKASPTSIAERWHAFRPEIEAALPPISVESPDRMNHVLEKLLIGTLECYIIYTEDAKGKTLIGIMTLAMTEQLDSLHNDLIIYTLSGTSEALSIEEWKEGLRIVQSIAKSKGCKSIILFASNPNIIRFLERIGADTSYHVVRIPV